MATIRIVRPSTNRCRVYSCRSLPVSVRPVLPRSRHQCCPDPAKSCPQSCPDPAVLSGSRPQSCPDSALSPVRIPQSCPDPALVLTGSASVQPDPASGTARVLSTSPVLHGFGLVTPTTQSLVSSLGLLTEFGLAPLIRLLIEFDPRLLSEFGLVSSIYSRSLVSFSLGLSTHGVWSRLV